MTSCPPQRSFADIHHSFVSIGSPGRPFATVDPALDDLLPADDAAWDQGVRCIFLLLAWELTSSRLLDQMSASPCLRR